MGGGLLPLARVLLVRLLVAPLRILLEVGPLCPNDRDGLGHRCRRRQNAECEQRGDPCLDLALELGWRALQVGRQNKLSGPRADSSAACEEDVHHLHGTALLSRRDLAHLSGARNTPFRTQYDLHTTVEVISKGGEITNLDKHTMIKNVNAMAVACTKWQLFTTPIPLLYTKHTLKFLSLWMTLMPLAFYDIFNTS